jgi:hypothetical protein
VYENYQELLLFEYFEFECLLIKLYKYECCTITGIWKQGSTYFVVKPIKYGLVLTFSPLIVSIIPIIIIGAENFLIVVIVLTMIQKVEILESFLHL